MLLELSGGHRGKWCMLEANGNQSTKVTTGVIDSIVAHRQQVVAVSTTVFIQQAETDDATTNQESRF